MFVFAVAALIMLTVAAVVAYPLLFQPAEPYLSGEAPAADFSERDALLDALDDVEHAFHSGKLSQRDYEAQRGSLEAQYVGVVEATAPVPHGNKPHGDGPPRKKRRR